MELVVNNSLESPIEVLMVDDREDGLIALEAALKDMPNLSLVRAKSGKEALQLLSQHEFAVILLDVQMPVLDGFQTASLIRQDEKYASTPIIFITAINKDDRYVDKGYSVGAVDYLFKPFDPHILRSKIAVFVDLFKKNRQLEKQNALVQESERRERILRLAELEVESLKRYRSLADAIPHIVWKSRVDGMLEYFNRFWTDYTGMSHDQSIGSGWQSAFHHEDLKEFLRLWIEAMETQAPFQHECRIRRSNGDMHWFLINVVPEFRRTEVVSWIGTCTDIHDRKMAESRLIEAEKTAISANIAKTSFLANMSHEIRTPLNAILGFTELMLNPDLSIDERIHNINIVRRSGYQLLKIIGEILDISKVEAGHLEIEKLEFDILPVLTELRSLMNVQALSKNIDLKFNLSNPIPQKLISDPTRIRQILVNMIGNAIKFTEKGQIIVSVSWIPDESIHNCGRMQFRITDTGMGIESIQAERLFQPFMQVDNSTTRRFGGTGLGLALSRQLAQALGGDALLEWSAPEKGSTFLIEIAATTNPKQNFLQNLEKVKEDKMVNQEFENSKDILRGISILLVDDAPDNRLLISRFLTLAGADVELARDGEEGVAKALKGDHEVVLMDIQMPHLDGYEATAQLRQKGYKQPIIALTAHAFKEEKERCLRVGCTDHMTKPVDRKLLVEHVARLVKSGT